MSEPTKAVFLSYAREDADAARRIAEALRGFGLEVWFDQDELRGGDAWDAKLKRQIRECGLFVPVVSAQTQARGEGYFRREWKLAVERTHDMAAGLAFIVPVVIDATPEAGALVPDEFMRYQWTRLPEGAPTPQFVEQVKLLLQSPRKPALKAAPPRPPTLPPMLKQAALARKAGEAAAAAPAGKPGVPAWLWGAAAVVAVAAGVAYIALRRPEPTPAAAPPVAAAKSAPATPDKSVAVLPFANMSADKENEFFTDGMHDDLITALAKVRDLKVISRTSVLAYRDTAARNLKKIAAELGVAAVLEGSVQRAGNRVRINLQLIDARTDSHLWAETYNRELTDIFALQAELVAQIAGTLKARLSGEETALLARRPTENQKAYDLYLRARVLDEALQVTSPRVEYQQVVDLYEEAANLDPAFALAFAQASMAHGQMYWFASLDPSPARRERVRATLEAARRLAPDSPEVKVAQGFYEYCCNNDWRKALENYRAAESGLPNDSRLLYRIALAHRRLAEWPAAFSCLERMAELNPNDMRGLSTLIETAGNLRRYAEVERLVARYPSRLLAEDRTVQAITNLARYERDGDRAGYLQRWAAQTETLAGPERLEQDYRVAVARGDLAAADRVLSDPQMPATINGPSNVVPEPVVLHRAWIALRLGRPDEARRLADEASGWLRGRTWTPRQEAVARLVAAGADAIAGRGEAALAAGRAAYADVGAKDLFLQAIFRAQWAKILLLCGRKEEAIEQLREMMAKPGGPAPSQVRHDLDWAAVKDDPRFEAILRSAKPL